MTLPSTNLFRVVAVTCACGLVVASAGFGAVFAYRVGIEHSILLAGLSILMAIALEGMKPLAFSACLQSFGSWNIARGLLLAVLGLVAVAYSLTSELSLVSMSRGDLAAERGSLVDVRKELQGMAPARPAPEVQADIAALKLDRLYERSKQCTEPAGDQSRGLCTRIASLDAERARADRRAELEGKLGAGHQVASADPGSAALVTYLAALGFVASGDAVGQWLNLVPVLALELGSALAAVLVQALPPAAPTGPVPGPATKPVNAGRTTGKNRQKDVEAKLVKHLKDKPEAPLSERGLAALLGSVSRSTVRRSIHSLAAAGVVALEAGRTGTIVRLLT